MTDLDRTSLDRILPPTPGSADWEDVLRRSGARHGVVAGASSCSLPPCSSLWWEPPLRSAAFAPSSPTRASSAWLRWEPRRVLPRAECSRCSTGSTERAPGEDRREKPQLGVRRRAADPAWCRVNGRLRRGFIEQRLTREGVKLLRSEILSTGLFGHDSRPARLQPSCLHGEQRARRQPTRQDNSARRTCTRRRRSSAMGKRSHRLEARLTDPESWLPASAWKQREFRAYVPSRFEVCAGAVVVPTSTNPDGARRADGSCSHRGSATGGSPERAPRQGTGDGRLGSPGDMSGLRAASHVTTNEARSLAKALDGAGPATARKGGAIRLHYTFDAPGPSRQVWISFDPFLPHGEVTCSQCG